MDYTWCDHMHCQHGVVRRHVEDVVCCVWGVVWTTRGVTTRGVTTWYANMVWCGGMWRMSNVVCGVVCMGCGVDYTWCANMVWCGGCGM